MTDTANRAGTIDYSTIDISLDDAKPEARPPFPGDITIDQFEDGRVYGAGDSGISWHLAVKPANSEKPFHSWIPLKYASEMVDNVKTFLDGTNGMPVKYSMSGEFGRVLNAIREVHGGKDAEGQQRKPGHGTLVGLSGFWLRETLTYGKDRVTGETRQGGKPSLIAVKAPKGAAASTTQPTPAAQFSEADTLVALLILDGRKPLEYQRGLMKAKTLADIFPDSESGGLAVTPEIKNAVLDGSAAKYLVAKGYATESGGVITAKAAVVV